ncbi:MAG: EamA family transporter [Deltaproteobacteria bacterium]|nr:EamA family transporter [Deltaproteobacteria bacterium]
MNGRAYLLSILTAFIWGIAPIFEKIGLSGEIEPYVAVVVRTIPIVLVSFTGLLFMGKVGSLGQLASKDVLFVTIGGLLAGFLGQITLYSALKIGQASVVVPIAATYPLVAMTVAVLFLGEPLTWQKVTGVVLVISGVMMLR